MSLVALVLALICFLLVLVPGVSWSSISLIAAGLAFLTVSFLLGAPRPWSKT